MSATLTEPNPEKLERSIVRFADLVGLFKPSAAQRRDGHIASISLGEDFGNLPIGALAAMGRDPNHPMMQMVEVTCAGLTNGTETRTPCPNQTRFKCMAYFSEGTICDVCRAKYEETVANAEKKKRWEAMCPASFLDTDQTHPGFPTHQHGLLKQWRADHSLLFIGPTGKGKSRLMVMMLKRAMRLGKAIGILWPDEIKMLDSSRFDNSLFESYAKVTVLGIDDPLLTVCRESKLVDVLKNLIDKRMRNNLVTIFTTQFANKQAMADAKEFGDAKSADMDRIDAILRRLEESCLVIKFTPPVERQEEAPFG